jgi:hypothetical protein
VGEERDGADRSIRPIEAGMQDIAVMPREGDFLGGHGEIS